MTFFLVMPVLLSEAMSSVTHSMLMSMVLASAAHQSPYEEKDSGQNHHHTYDVALLGINLLLKPQTNHSNDPS